jgi:transposase
MIFQNSAWGSNRATFIGEKSNLGLVMHGINRKFINGVWILRTGTTWRDLPPEYGDWKNTHRRSCRWRDRGVWERIFEGVVDDVDFEWFLMDAGFIKVHPHAAGS